MKRRNRHRGHGNKTRQERREGPLTLMRHPFSGLDPDLVRAAIAKLATKRAEEFPVLMERLISVLRDKNPLQILATLAAYGLHVGVSDEGVATNSFAPKIDQHHIEVVQALLLTVPLREWGPRPALPADIQSVMDTAAALAQAFHERRFKTVESEQDFQARTILGLQERLRLHTQVVRNWGYFSQVGKICEKLYGPLDADFRVVHGFGPTDLIKIARQLTSRLEERMSERFRRLKQIFRERKIHRLVRLYYKLTPGIEDEEAEEFIRGLSKDANWDGVAARLLAHADLDLWELFLSTVDEIASSAGLSPDVTRRVLETLSLLPGDLESENKDHLFLSNPVWRSPVIFLGDKFFCALPTAIFSHIHEIVRSLVDTDGNLKSALEARRAIYLEEQVKGILASTFQGAQLRHGVKWWDHDALYETDHVVLLDKTLLIVEDKSAALTAPALRGAPDRAKRHVQDLVVDPSLQSARLQSVILKVQDGDEAATAALAVFGIDFSQIDTVVRLTVTLDDFSVLSSAEPDLKEAGWIPNGTSLAVTMGIADLRCIVDILERPFFLIHYFMERERIQKTTHIVADEMDFLGFYLETGFNVGDLAAEQISLALTGMSRPIDHYYDSRDAGVVLNKPKPKLLPYLLSVLRRIETRAFPGWLRVSIDLLRSGSPDEQKTLGRLLETLRRNVERNWRNPKHECSVVIIPPQMRETVIVFFAYPQKLAERRKDSAQELMATALDESGRSRCIVIGRNIDLWDEPYSFVFVGDGKQAWGGQRREAPCRRVHPDH